MRWEWGRGRIQRSFHEWRRLGIGWKCVLFCEWGPVLGIQLQPLPDVAAAARSPIHKTGPAARRGGGASIGPLRCVKVFPGGTRRGVCVGGGEHKGSGLYSWMNSSLPFRLFFFLIYTLNKIFLALEL